MICIDLYRFVSIWSDLCRCVRFREKRMLFGKIKMWVHRISAKGGFLFDVYVNDASTCVTHMGTTYLYNIGWHPLRNPFVSDLDNTILEKRGLLCERG